MPRNRILRNIKTQACRARAIRKYNHTHRTRMCDKCVSCVAFDKLIAPAILHTRTMNAAYTLYDIVLTAVECVTGREQFSARKHKRTVNYYGNNITTQLGTTVRT